jgi:hypothetical protein
MKNGKKNRRISIFPCFSHLFPYLYLRAVTINDTSPVKNDSEARKNDMSPGKSHSEAWENDCVLQKYFYPIE